MAEMAEDMEDIKEQERKQRKKTLTKVVVSIVIGLIILSVLVIWLFKKDSALSIRFNSHFVFIAKVLRLEITGDNHEGLLYGELGQHINAAPFETCYDPETLSEEPNCLLWDKKAYLRVSHNSSVSENCYTIRWTGIGKDFISEDCFYLQTNNWYGYMSHGNQFWPIKNVENSRMQYYLQYPEQETMSLVPSWLGSQGIAIFIHSSFPFILRWNHTYKRQFCFASQLPVRRRHEAVVVDGVDELKYTVCHGGNLSHLYRQAQRHRQSWEAHLTKDSRSIQPIMFPILAVGSSDEVAPMMTLLRERRIRCRLVMLPDNWAVHFGDLQFDMARLLRHLMAEAGKVGCGTVLPVSTFFTYQSRLFQDGLRHGYFLRDRLNLATRLFRWREYNGAMLDTANSEAVQWFLSHLMLLVNSTSFNIKALKLLHVDVPRDARFFNRNMTFLDYSRLFYRDASQLLGITLILEQAMGFVSEPIFLPVRITLDASFDARCFNSVVPWALYLGFNGYPLLLADGSHLQSVEHLPLGFFQRWLQLAILFPAFQVSYSPYLNGTFMLEYMDRLLMIRRLVLRHMEAEWAESLKPPLLKPLWWYYPNDRKAQTLSNQFMISETLLAAPVLCYPMHYHTVYLPVGVWKCISDPGCTGIHAGPKHIHFSNIDIEDVFLFKKVSGDRSVG